MKTSICLSLILVATIVSCNEPNHPDIINEPFAGEQARIKAMLNNIFDVAKAKDMDSLDSYHLNGPKFSKFDDGEIPGRQNYEMGKKTENDFFMGVSEFDYSLVDPKVDVFGDAAVATFIIDYDVQVSDTTISGSSRGTLVFVRNGGQWKIAHEHFSPLSKGRFPCLRFVFCRVNYNLPKTDYQYDDGATAGTEISHWPF